MNNLFPRAVADQSFCLRSCHRGEERREIAREKEEERKGEGRVDEMRVGLLEIAPSLQLNNWVLSREKRARALVIYRSGCLRRRERRMARGFDRYPADLAIVRQRRTRAVLNLAGS